jgi:large subunit ribosomal protein L22
LLQVTPLLLKQLQLPDNSIMQIQAYTKYSRMSAKKVREVAREIQGKNAAEASELLRFIPRKSARLLRKTLLSAIANAENNNNLVADSLTIEKAVVEEGPKLKRFRPASRGSAHPYSKKTSHIRIVLTDEA